MEPGKWIWLKDRLPNEKEQNELLLVAWLSTDNTIKYMCDAEFDSKTKQFNIVDDWGKDYLLEPNVWAVVPHPTPRTRRTNMCERENLIWEYAEDLEPNEMVYRTADVNEVMDKMEARIKQLEKENKQLKQDLDDADSLLIHY